VDDFVAHIDRRTEALDGELDDLDRAVNAGAEAARGGDEQAKRGERFGLAKRQGPGRDVSDCLQPAKALPMTAADSIAFRAPASCRRRRLKNKDRPS
jgi:hypothetical protein